MKYKSSLQVKHEGISNRKNHHLSLFKICYQMEELNKRYESFARGRIILRSELQICYQHRIVNNQAYGGPLNPEHKFARYMQKLSHNLFKLHYLTQSQL